MHHTTVQVCMRMRTGEDPPERMVEVMEAAGVLTLNNSQPLSVSTADFSQCHTPLGSVRSQGVDRHSHRVRVRSGK